MLRIAYCSPVNPAPTGISDYSEELLPYLGQYADITLYLEDGLHPTNPNLSAHLAIAPLRKLERDHRRKPYDAILYHMGNSPAHAGIWRVAQRVPGVVVLHDFVLHHFMLWYAANVRHDVQHYVRDMAAQYGEAGHHIAQLMIRGRFTEAAFDFACCEPVVAAAVGIIAHSRYVRDRVAALRPDVGVAVVPMGVPLPAPLPRGEARAHLGLPENALILASFGHINAYKRVESVLRALQELRIAYPDLRYLLVGSVSPNYDAAGLVQRMGLQDCVQMTGYVSQQEFGAYVAAADICINLRHPTAGETSASLLRLLGAGRPTLVSTTGAFAELPPDVAAQVETGPDEREYILAYCRLLAGRPEVAAALGENARAYIARNHSLEQAAEGYMRFLSHLYQWGGTETVPPIRPAPLWEVATDEPPNPAGSLPSGSTPSATNLERPAVAPDAVPVPAPESPPLPVPDIARRIVEIGATEQNKPLLHTVAQHLYDIMDHEEDTR